MSYESVEERVDRLEALFGQFLTQLLVMNKKAEERHQAAEERHRAAEERMARFENEMREFKDEMREFKDEMRKFKDEMRKFKDEMQDFKEEMRRDRKDLNQKWGELANKMGTIVEDILAPNLRRLAKEHFRFPVIVDFMIRRRRCRPDMPSVADEFDTIVVGPDAVILGDAKSSPRIEHAEAFARKRDSFFDFFPEYAGRRLILVLGSWSIPEDVISRLTSLGIYAMQMGEETMELVNARELERET